MAKPIFALAPIAALAIVILFPLAVASADKAPKSIGISELSKLQVIGWLGQPLGRIVTIEGVVVDGSYTRCKADEGQSLLRVQVVDGKQLPKEQVFHFDPFLAELEKPTVGSKFKYIGYETGGFTGVPAKAFDHVPAIATTGYYFTTHFVVLRDALKQK